MTQHSMTHSSLNLDRHFEATPEQVFAAWASVEALKKWAVPVEGWKADYADYVLETGGKERSTFTTPEGDVLENTGEFADVLPAQRFVSLYSMSHNGTRIFSGLLAVEFVPDGTGTHLKMTEQGVFYDGHDKPENHKLGYRSMLEDLSAFLAAA